MSASSSTPHSGRASGALTQRPTLRWGLLVALGLLPIAVLGLAAYILTSLSVRSLVQQNNQSAAEITVELVKRDLEHSATLAEAVAALPGMIEAVEEHDEEAVRARLKAVVDAYPRVDRAFVLDLEGKLWSDYPLAEESLGKNFAYRDYFRGAKESSRTYISEVYQRNAKPKPLVVAISTPVSNDQQTTIGYLVYQYRLDGITTWLKGINVGQGGYVFLVDHTGTIAAHPRLDLESRQYDEYDAVPLVQAARRRGLDSAAAASPTVEYVDPLAQQTMVATALPVAAGQQRWVVVAQQPRDSAYSPTYRLGRQIGFAAAILALAACGVVLALGRISDRNARLNAELRERHSELQQRTADLHGQIERTRRIVDTAHDAFVAMDADGKIIDWNPQAEALFGWTREEALGRLVAETIVPPALRETHRQGLERFLATGEGPVLNQRIEVPAQNRAGASFPVELTITPLRDGEKYIFAAFLHDITQRKQAEADLQRAKEAAEAADRAKSEFLANMSHEIRTPMNGVIGMADLLAGTPLRGDQREFLTLIQQSAESLLRLLNDILDFSKIEAGRLELESIEFPLADCVGKAIQLLTLRAADKGLELACRIDPAIPDRLIGDPGRLRQVIVNLVGNAIKFTDHGEVVVNVQPAAPADDSAAPAASDATPTNQDRIRLHVSVRDTGIGIPSDKLTKLFKAFSQADTSTTRKYGGTGLGLVISERLVEMMRGRIWVESEPGSGTTFHVIVDFGIAAEQKPHAPAELFRLRNLPVLVVDDNATNRRILKELLTNWGLAPTLAEDGHAGLHLADEALRRGEPFRLVLLDYHMPGMDGVTLAERLQAQADGDPCPMIMLSSSVAGLQPDELRRLGIGRFLTKPVIGSDLLEVMLAELGVVAAKVVESDQEIRPPVEPRRILLAEDSPINQKVALGFLTKWGHEVVVAVNGRKAVEVFQREAFDLILMDVQMPEMNGYDATAAIRALEQPGAIPIPIIAMTAEALKGDRERCLDAGMSDYVAKPIDPDILYRVVAECGSRRAADVSGPKPDASLEMPAKSAIDWEVARRFTGGDAALLQELIDTAREQTPRLLADLRQSQAESDLELLRRSVHTLKSSANYFGASRLADVALHIETLARDEKLADAVCAIPQLESEAARFLAELDEQASLPS